MWSFWFRLLFICDLPSIKAAPFLYYTSVLISTKITTVFSLWDPYWTQPRGLTKLKDWDYLQVQHTSWSLVLPYSRNHGMFTSPLEAPATSWFHIRFLCGSVLNSKSVINYGANTTIKYNGKESKEYFDIINIDYYDTILEIPFLRKHEVIINFINNCLIIKDKIVCNQANEYKVGEGNPQKKKKRTFQWKHWNRRNQKFLLKIANDYLKNHILEGVIKRTLQTVWPRSQWVWRKKWASTHAQIFLNYMRKLLRNTVRAKFRSKLDMLKLMNICT